MFCIRLWLFWNEIHRSRSLWQETIRACHMNVLGPHMALPFAGVLTPYTKSMCLKIGTVFRIANKILPEESEFGLLRWWLLVKTYLSVATKDLEFPQMVLMFGIRLWLFWNEIHRSRSLWQETIRACHMNVLGPHMALPFAGVLTPYTKSMCLRIGTVFGIAIKIWPEESEFGHLRWWLLVET